MSKIFENKKVQLAISFFKWLAQIMFYGLNVLAFFAIYSLMIGTMFDLGNIYPQSYWQFLTENETADVYQYYDILMDSLLLLEVYILGAILGLFSRFFRAVETFFILCCCWMIFNVIYQLQVDDIAASNPQSVEVSSEAVDE